MPYHESIYQVYHLSNTFVFEIYILLASPWTY